jgi:hypothetical protein
LGTGTASAGFLKLSLGELHNKSFNLPRKEARSIRRYKGIRVHLKRHMEENCTATAALPDHMIFKAPYHDTTKVFR